MSALDPDLGWHLQVGREIILTGAAPQANLYNFSYIGNWVDHEWLANVLMYEVYARCGYVALALLSCLPLLIALIVLNIRTSRQISSNALKILVIGGLQIIGLLICLHYFGTRVQVIAPLFLVFELLIINRYQARRRPSQLLWLWPLFLLWANLHASFLLGLFIVLAWAGFKTIEALLNKNWHFTWLPPDNIFSFKQLRIIWTVAMIAGLATLLTPYGLGLYSLLAEYRNTIYLSYIEEWRAQWTRPYNYFELGFIGLTFIILSAAVWLNTYRKRIKSNLWSIFLAIIFLGLALKSRRHLPIFFVATFEITAYAGTDFLNGLFNSVRERWQGITRNRLIVSIFKSAVLIYLAILISLQVGNIHLFSNPFAYFSIAYPYDAVNYLKSNPAYASGNIFNTYNWGGYLIWQYPEKQIFIDGRFPQAPMDGHTFLQEYLQFFGSEQEIAEALRKYDISLVILANKAEDRELSKYLRKQSDWQLIYGDPVSLVFYRITSL